MPSETLAHSFYQREDVVQVSRDLIGKVLCTKIGGHSLTSGIITETEAYRGRNDKACHANNGKRTDRTEIMYHRGGLAYVYLCYGIHHMFNVVTNIQDTADAILIRAIKPLKGMETMLGRRNSKKNSPKLTAGPGRLTQALGINIDFYGTDLAGDTIWIEDRGDTISQKDIRSSPRIGVGYAGKDANRPWRFYIKGNSWVS